MSKEKLGGLEKHPEPHRRSPGKSATLEHTLNASLQNLLSGRGKAAHPGRGLSPRPSAQRQPSGCRSHRTSSSVGTRKAGFSQSRSAQLLHLLSLSQTLNKWASLTKHKKQSEAPRQGQGHFPRLLRETCRSSKDSPTLDFHGLEWAHGPIPWATKAEVSPWRPPCLHVAHSTSRTTSTKATAQAKIKAKVWQSSEELCQQKPHEIPSPTHLCRRQ